MGRPQAVAETVTHSAVNQASPDDDDEMEWPYSSLYFDAHLMDPLLLIRLLDSTVYKPRWQSTVPGSVMGYMEVVDQKCIFQWKCA